MKKVACFFGSMAFRVLLIGTMAIFGTVGNVSGSPPTIVGDPAAISMHWVSDFPYVDENGNAYPRREDYGISFNAIVHDEQGPDNILSVIVTDLEGNEYLLNDEGLQGDLNVHDGVYQLMQRGLSTPPNFSTYVFTVTNKQGEFSSKLDVIDQICDVAEVQTPNNGQIVTQPNPTFSWNAVIGATVYTVSVGNWRETLWQTSVNGTSVTYDGPALTNGDFYFWDISTTDTENNFSHHYDMNFAFSFDAAKPLIGMPLVMTGSRYNAETHRREYSHGFFAFVADPQGLNSILAVAAYGPGGQHYELNDAARDGDLVANDGIYQLWGHSWSTQPEAGTYDFKVSDVDGHSEAMPQQTTCITLKEPSWVSPSAGEITVDEAPTFQWERVDGATQYQIVVKDSNDRDLWSASLPHTRLSVDYNFNNTGTPLILGQKYKWEITAHDDYYNSSSRYNIAFQFSTGSSSGGGGGGGGGCFITTLIE